MTDSNYAWLKRWLRDHFRVDRYRCNACGFEIKFSRANLRSLGIDPDTMYHSHARLITNDTSAILNNFTESNADRRLIPTLRGKQ